MPFLPLLLSFLRANWLTVGMGAMLIALSINIAFKSHRIKSLELELGQAHLAIDKAQAEYKAQALRVAALNESNQREVAEIREDYRKTLTEERKKHAQTYRIAIAHADAAGRMRLATDRAGTSTMPEDDAAAARADGKAEGGQAAESVSVGDCIDAAIQIEGLQRYIQTELAHINGEPSQDQ